MKERKLNLTIFETPHQVAEYVGGLIKHDLPQKFSYFGSAAHTHNRLVDTSQYLLTNTEINLIKKKLGFLLPLSELSNHVIVDIGSGNGIKAVEILKLIPLGNKITYVGLDYSAELLSIARKNITRTFPNINLLSAQIDFEADKFDANINDLQVNQSSPRLFLFLGHAIGNPSDRTQVLSNIQKSMRQVDKLIIGLEFYRSRNVMSILSNYENSTFREAVFHHLGFANIKPTDGQIVVRFNNDKRDVEAFFTFSKDLEIFIDTNHERSVKFITGDSIKLFISHRFTLYETKQILKRSNLNVTGLVKSADKSYALILCSLGQVQD